jgi:T-complex protein 1 subunit gamma
MVLNHNAKREQGKQAQQANIKAAKAVADIVRTTLGPKSMLKMLLDPMGGIVLTNDGNAILREVSPPLILIFIFYLDRCCPSRC